jgi:hypothetical protein
MTKWIAFVLLAGMTLGCHSEFKTTFTPHPEGCPIPCYPCDGKGPAHFYETPPESKVCAIDGDDVDRDALCFGRYASGTDLGWPRCFYGCGDDATTCVPVKP